MISFRRTTEVSLAVILTLIAVTGGAISYWSTMAESDAFMDLQQRQIARYVGDLTFVASADAALPPHDTEDDYVVEVTYANGQAPRSSDQSVIIPDQRETGFSEFDAGETHWRVFSLVTTERTVQVAQQTVVRQELAAEAALRATIPFLLAIPLSWLVVAIVVNRVFGRLEALAMELASEGQNGDRPLELSKVPRELLPFVLSMNHLLVRLRMALETQKTFLSDAAHELRTPISALTLQIGNLIRHKGGDLEDRLIQLERGSRRISVLINQLLKIARYESLPDAVVRQPVRLDEVTKDVVASLIPFAEERGVDLGFAALNPSTVQVYEGDLRSLIEVLIDNAVRYTPAGGAVDVTVVGGEPRCLYVTDNGPGVPDDSLPHLTKRFYRGVHHDAEGTGLGLAIAEAICKRNGLLLFLTNAEKGGLVAQVQFPMLPEPQPLS